MILFFKWAVRGFIFVIREAGDNFSPADLIIPQPENTPLQETIKSNRTNFE